MVCKITDSIWFDPDKLYIIKGENKVEKYLEHYDSYPYAKDFQKSDVSYPVVTFLSSVLCNLQCIYCYADQGNYNNISDKNTFSFENYLKAFEIIMAEYGGIKNICFFGGEPLIDFTEIKRFVVYLHNHYEKKLLPSFSIGSNGTIIDDDILNFLSEYNILFGTSLDGNRFLNDKSRIGSEISSVYDRVMNTIRRLDEYNIPCVIQFTFNQFHLNDYKPGDVRLWMKELECLPIKYYEIIAATTKGNPCEIDLSDNNNLSKLEMFCSEIAQYSLEAFVDGRTTIMSSIFSSLICLLSKRTKSGCCAAGYNITISPDMRIYPCHTIANNRLNSIPCKNGFRKEIEKSLVFEKIKNMTRSSFRKCSECLAKNVCGVFCKGMCEVYNEPPEERCIMMRVFLRETIVFLSDVYPLHKKKIVESLKRTIDEHSVM